MDKGKIITENFERILAFTKDWIGKHISVSIALTNRNYNRHGTSYTNFSFQLEDVRSRISGARLMFSGVHDLVEVDLHQLVEVKTEEGVLSLIERLRDADHKETAIYRKVEFTTINRDRP